MPDVYLDGIKIEFEDSGDASIWELVAALEKELTGLKRFILGLSIDGRQIENWRQCDVLREPISSHQDYNIKTGSVETVALEGLSLLQEYFGIIKKDIEVCSHALRLGGDAAQPFTAVFEGIIEAVRTMDALRQGAVAEGIDLFRENPQVFYDPLISNLERLKETRASGDDVYLADILEYELLPLIEKIEERLFFCATA